jgi:hypothetical protein
LERIPFLQNSDDFLFDNQFLVQAVWLGLEIGEVSCPARYTEDASSISAERALVYGMGVLQAATGYRLARWGLKRPAFLKGI